MPSEPDDGDDTTDERTDPTDDPTPTAVAANPAATSAGDGSPIPYRLTPILTVATPAIKRLKTGRFSG